MSRNVVGLPSALLRGAGFVRVALGLEELSSETTMSPRSLDHRSLHRESLRTCETGEQFLEPRRSGYVPSLPAPYAVEAQCRKLRFPAHPISRCRLDQSHLWSASLRVDHVWENALTAF